MWLFKYYGLPSFVVLNLGCTLIEYFFLKLARRPISYDLGEIRVTGLIHLVQLFTNGLFITTHGIMVYYLFNHRIFTWPPVNPWLIFPIGLFVSEFAYYCSHRFLHRVRIGWVNHWVHHVPTRLNVTMSARISLTGTLGLAWLFYLPMASLGFSPKAIGLYTFINLVYQYFLHTELDPKLGWLEKIFVTPSHHRVHHDTAAECLDKNYGGIFIVFDHWFGTFKAEDKSKKAVFGVLDKVDSRSFFQSTMMGWVYLYRDLKRCPGFANKLLLFFKPPGWLPIRNGIRDAATDQSEVA